MGCNNNVYKKGGENMEQEEIKKPRGWALTKLKPAGDPYSDWVRSKRKGSASDKRKQAQKINSIPYMKEGTRKKMIYELASNPAIDRMYIQTMLQKLADMNLDTKEFMEFLKVSITFFSKKFGEEIRMGPSVAFEEQLKEWRRRKQSERVVEYKHLEASHKEWIKEFGEKQADAMKYAILYKYNDGAKEVEQGKKEIEKALN